jgi:hypothetical protein
MTTLTDATGALLTKAALPKTAVVITDGVKITNPVWESYKLPGEKGFTGRRLKWYAGQEVSQADFDNAWAAATFTSVTPATGPAAGGTNVTIKGTNLRGVSNVTFNAVNATNIVVVDEETITCTTPAVAAGARTIVLVDDAGNVTAPSAYTYT